MHVIGKRQSELNGMERPNIKTLDKKALAYLTVRDERMALTSKEVDAKAELAKSMHEHREALERTSDDGYVYRFTDGEFAYDCILACGVEKLKVKRVTDDEDTEGSDIG